MKKLLLILIVAFIANGSFAQEGDDATTKGFKKDHLFTGGSVSASFFNGTTSLGLIPHFGYSFNRFIDVAASVNFNYISQRDYVVYGDKARQTVFGPGAFVRLFPVKFLFAQGQYEHNFVRFKYLPANNSGYTAFTEKRDANSILVGGGYCSGREQGQNSYYYLSVLWDVTKVSGSPYLDGLGRPYAIIRAGFNVALFQGGYHHRRRN